MLLPQRASHHEMVPHAEDQRSGHRKRKQQRARAAVRGPEEHHGGDWADRDDNQNEDQFLKRP